MTRRNLFFSSAVALASAKTPEHLDAAWYRHNRRFASLPMSRVAYIDHGSGPVALFLHGYPLNSYQWRGAIQQLHTYRRCIAPDVMGMGFTETPEGQSIKPEKMLASLLDFLHAGAVDLVANDSGGLVAQLFLARHPERVRSLLLTNCDVDENNPPAQFVPLIELAKRGQMVDRFIVPQLANKQLARSSKGIGGIAYSFPDQLSDETIEAYFRPLVATPLKKSQVDAYAVALGENVLVAVRDRLEQWNGPVRMVWGMKDTLFGIEWAEWLDRKLPGSHGIRRVDGANLFFPEEMPDLIAEEARTLWRVLP